MDKFLFANVAKYAKGEPQQIEWGESLDRRLESNGVLSIADIDEFAEIWRRRSPAPEKSIGVDLGGYQLTKPILEACMGTTVSLEELEDMNFCVNKYEINKTKARLCFFLAQCGHESAGLYYRKEIDQGWYIPDDWGVPPIAASDGAYKYRGAGYIQLSLPDNYRAFADYIGDGKIYSEGCPYVADHYPATSAGFWWKINNMNDHVDAGENMYQISGRVNRGSPDKEALHMPDRLNYYYRCVDAIPEF